MSANDPKESNGILMKILVSLNELTNRLDTIEKAVGKIHEIKDTLIILANKIERNEQKVDEIKVHNKQMEERIEKMEQRIANVSDKCSNNKTNIDEVNAKIMTNEENITKSAVDYKEITELKDKLTDLKCATMKENLVFSGLPYQKNEMCTIKIQNFLRQELGFTYGVSLAKAHRFGKVGLNGVRPIIVKFLYRTELEDVLRSKCRLRGKPYGINEQYPLEIEKKRRELYPIMKQAKKEGKKCKLVKDKLYINGKPYEDIEDTNVIINEYGETKHNAKESSVKEKSPIQKKNSRNRKR